MREKKVGLKGKIGAIFTTCHPNILYITNCQASQLELIASCITNLGNIIIC